FRLFCTVGAVYEGVTECEAGNSPPGTGGVAAPSRKRCEATAAAQTGWSASRSVSSCVTTPSAPSKEASRLLLGVASTPPMSGGEWRTQFIHSYRSQTTSTVMRFLLFLVFCSAFLGQDHGITVFDTPDFTLKLVIASQTLASLQPK